MILKKNKPIKAQYGRYLGRLAKHAKKLVSAGARNVDELKREADEVMDEILQGIRNTGTVKKDVLAGFVEKARRLGYGTVDINRKIKNIEDAINTGMVPENYNDIDLYRDKPTIHADVSDDIGTKARYEATLRQDAGTGNPIRRVLINAPDENTGGRFNAKLKNTQNPEIDNMGFFWHHPYYAGKAWHTLNKIMPSGTSISEEGSLSADSFGLFLNMLKDNSFVPSYAGRVKSNSMADRAPWPGTNTRNSMFDTKAEAEEVAGQINNYLGNYLPKVGIENPNARVTIRSHPAISQDAHVLELPRFKVIKKRVGGILFKKKK